MTLRTTCNIISNCQNFLYMLFDFISIRRSMMTGRTARFSCGTRANLCAASALGPGHKESQPMICGCPTCQLTLPMMSSLMRW